MRLGGMNEQAKILIIDDSPADIHVLGGILGKDYQNCSLRPMVSMVWTSLCASGRT